MFGSPSRRRGHSPASSLSPMRVNIDAHSIALTEEERSWIIDIKNEVDKEPKQFGNPTDWEVLQHAFIAKENTAQALRRLRRLKQFKESHAIDQTFNVYEAVKIVHSFVVSNPGCLQGFTHDHFGRPVISLEVSCLNAIIQDKIQSTALYFILMAMQCSVESIRNGSVWICDFDGVTRKDHLTYSLLRHISALCSNSFPIKVKTVMATRAPPVVSGLYVMCRAFLSQTIATRMNYDCSVEAVRQAYSPEFLGKMHGGTQTELQILDQLETCLRKRFESEHKFQFR